MMYAGRLLAALALMAVSAESRPNHLKAVVVDKEPQASAAASIPSVSASFGPYSAAAGLGPGGLYAGADSPHGSAAAGLGAEGAGAGAVAGGGEELPPPPPPQRPPHKPIKPAKPVHGGPTFFDSIFNIPISILEAVNQNLNNHPVPVKPVHPHHRRRWHQEPHKTETVEKQAGPAPADAADAAAPANHSEASASADAGASAPAGPYVRKTNWLSVPVAALRSVNALLNGGIAPYSSSSSGSSSHSH